MTSPPAPKGPPSEVPDLLGEEGRASLLAQRILELQREWFLLDSTRLMNEHELEENVPGLQPPDTYLGRAEKIKAAEGRLLSENPHLVTAITRIANARAQRVTPE